MYHAYVSRRVGPSRLIFEIHSRLWNKKIGIHPEFLRPYQRILFVRLTYIYIDAEYIHSHIYIFCTPRGCLRCPRFARKYPEQRAPTQRKTYASERRNRTCAHTHENVCMKTRYLTTNQNIFKISRMNDSHQQTKLCL